MKTAIIIDGGHLRVLAKQAGYWYDPDYIEAVSKACFEKDEFQFRVLYYDCAPYNGSRKRPVSRKSQEFKGSDKWLETLAAKPLLAVRRGILKFRGYVFKKSLARIPSLPPSLSDKHFKPRFEQKGVDMRIGLDMATYAANRTVDRIVLVTGDTDFLPAMKLARTAGLQIVLVQFPGQRLAQELLWHSDFQRLVEWPS